jgi:hypothetical protein
MNDKRPCKSNRPKERAIILDDFEGKNAKFHRSAASAKTIRSITITFLVSIPHSK